MPTVQSTKSISKSTQPKAVNSSEDKPIKEIDDIQKSKDTTMNIGNKNTVTDPRTPPEQPEFIKQALIIIEKKARNLDKRRQKLDEYKDIQRKGSVLNEDQLNAISKYDEVIRTLELLREMEKSFISLANDAMKQQKKQTKRDQLEKEESIMDAVKEKLKDSQRYLALLNAFNNNIVRSDFLAGSNGALQISQEEIDQIENFDKLVKKDVCSHAEFDNKLNESIEHLLAFIDAKHKQIPTMSINYFDLKKFFDKILSCDYWNNSGVSNETTNPLIEPIEQQQQYNDEFEVTNNFEQNNQQMVQQSKIYCQDNNTDTDFVIVSTNTINVIQQKPLSNDKQNDSQNDEFQQQQQQQQKIPFFTTLNTTDFPASHQNINDFINKCENNDEGLNFFQDSEIRQQQYNNIEFNQNEPQRNDHFKSRNSRGNYQQRPRYSDERRNNGPVHSSKEMRSNNRENNNQKTGVQNTHRQQNGPGMNGGSVEQQRSYNNNNNSKHPVSQGGYRNQPNNNRGYQRNNNQASSGNRNTGNQGQRRDNSQKIPRNNNNNQEILQQNPESA